MVKESLDRGRTIESPFAFAPQVLGGGFTAAELCAVIKTTYEDFVSGKTNRKAVESLTKLLELALASRRQSIIEREKASALLCNNYYN